MTEYALSLVLFAVGLYAVLAKRDMMKLIIGVAVMGYAVNMFLLLAGFSVNGDIPVLKEGGPRFATVDPVPQALVLASIVIGLAITVLLSALALKLYEKHGTLDISKIKEMKG